MSQQVHLPHVAYSVRFIDGPGVDFEVERFVAEEGIGTCYRVLLDLTSDRLDVGVGDLIGLDCEVILQRRGFTPSPFYGVVDRVVCLGRQGQRLGLQVQVVSAFELAKQRTHSRIWQATSVQDIVSGVLGEAFADHERVVELSSLSRGATPRDYCVQYRETDFDFVCRLLEEEGISWFFVHDLDSCKEILTLCDHNDQYPPIETFGGDSTIPLVEHNVDEGAVEAFEHFRVCQRLTSNAAGRSDFDFLLPSDLLTANHQVADGKGRIRRVYEHGQRRFIEDDLARRVEDQVDASLGEGIVATAIGNPTCARPGCTFVLEDMDLEFEDSQGTEEWLVTRAGYDSGEGAARIFRPRFECRPKNATLRPLQTTPKPRVQGPQTATVVGEGEIDVDEHGRIEVQFHWEEEPSFAAGASCRVRCAQSWAGPVWGAQFIPRVGMEVVVEFLEGNPDRPLVTGCVYNGNNSPPFALPENSSQSGWRTNSLPGGGGSNELRFEDAAGAEEIYIHAQKDKNIEINNNRSQVIGNDESMSVGHDRSRSVGNNEDVSVGTDRSVSVGTNFSEAIGADMTQSVGANQAVSVGFNRSVVVGANHDLQIVAVSNEIVGASKSVTVGMAMQTTVGAAMNTSVGAACAEQVGGVKSVVVGVSSSETVAGAKTVSAATISESARGEFSIDAGAKLGISAGADTTQISKGNYALSGDKKGSISFKDELTIEVGKAKIVLKKNGDILIEGGKLTFKGSKDVKIKGKKVLSN